MRNTVITEDNKDQILEDVSSSADFTPTEVDLLIHAFLDTSMSDKKDLQGKTVGQVLDEAKKLPGAYDLDEYKKYTAADPGSVPDDLRNCLYMVPLKKVYQIPNVYAGIYDERIVVELLITNKSGKDIDAFRGRIIYKDKNGDILANNLVVDRSGIKPDEDRRIYDIIPYDRFSKKKNMLRDLDLKNISFHWYPQKIAFKDAGSTPQEKH